MAYIAECIHDGSSQGHVMGKEVSKHRCRRYKDVAFSTSLTSYVYMALRVRVAPTKLLHWRRHLPRKSGPLQQERNEKAYVVLRQFSPQVVLQNLLICVILFYTVYYVTLSLCCLTLKVCELDVLAPFDFKTTPSWLNTHYKVLLVSTEVTYFVCGLLFALVVEEWLWDYAITVTILHVAITSAVMLEFPLTSHWWAALDNDDDV
ncbi:putative transmembrane protein 244 [Lepus europaeus]|uniref:putative transmembrane protein 244 n=1 Tax=Lepus europaeus TaxID=9983 RepID=UPI002B49B1A7|nr:putative transmembrane protein 244 [Lepus europaeus]